LGRVSWGRKPAAQRDLLNPSPLGSVAQGKSFTAVPMFRHVPEMFQRFWNRVSPSSLLAEPSLSCALFQINRNR
jgi:hypothetical protein